MTHAQASNFITNARQAASSLIAALNQFRAAQAEYNGFNAKDELTSEHFVSANEGLTPSDIHTAMATIDGVLSGLGSQAINTVYKIKL